MTFSDLLLRIRGSVEEKITVLPAPWPRLTLFLSFSDTAHRARVVHASGDSFEEVWRQAAVLGQRQAARESLKVHWLRADWVTYAERMNCEVLRAHLRNCKRNYFRYGLAFDQAFQIAFLEQELNANAMLYGGGQISHAVINEKNFNRYASIRFKQSALDFSANSEVVVFSTHGVFCAPDLEPQLLYPSGRHAGRRILKTLDAATLQGLINRGSLYLSEQVKMNGRFYYGWHPCFDRPINTYNTLRHASTTYAMLESWEVTRNDKVFSAIERALGYLTDYLIKTRKLPNGEQASFLVDRANEIKLGGNAVCLLALTKYTELTGSARYHKLLHRLAVGIQYMQGKLTGGFVHVLHYPQLSVKETFRTIYYDGEAAFGLMRLYRLTKNARWLAVVERAFEWFIARQHWKAHDHWLSYAVNELTCYRPEQKYYQFGIRNVAGHLDFVRKRITTYPTLLELMMAAKVMLDRIGRQPEHRHLLQTIDLNKFQKALEFRAHYLLNGHFWPEYAMYFQNPKRILGSFFIRHQAFRVRIDDVEHYLSGLVAYLRELENNTPVVTAVKEHYDNEEIE